MSGEAIFFLVFFMGLISFTCFEIHRSNKKKAAAEAKEKALNEKIIKLIEECNKKLEEEMAKPKYRIRFIDDRREEHICIPFDPYKIHNEDARSVDEVLTVVTSKERAQRFLDFAYNRGYFKDEQLVIYPVCNIHKAFVEVAE